MTQQVRDQEILLRFCWFIQSHPQARLLPAHDDSKVIDGWALYISPTDYSLQVRPASTPRRAPITELEFVLRANEWRYEFSTEPGFLKFSDEDISLARYALVSRYDRRYIMRWTIHQPDAMARDLLLARLGETPNWIWNTAQSLAARQIAPHVDGV